MTVVESKWTMAQPLIAAFFVVRIILGLVLIYSGLSKSLSPWEFARAIRAYQIVGAEMSVAVAVVLPWAEIVAGACLVMCVLLPGATLISAMLFLLFCCAIGSALARDLSITCGCFASTNSSTISLWTLLRAVVFLVFGVALFLFGIRGKAPLDTGGDRQV